MSFNWGSICLTRPIYGLKSNAILSVIPEFEKDYERERGQFLSTFASILLSYLFLRYYKVTNQREILINYYCINFWS